MQNRYPKAAVLLCTALSLFSCGFQKKPHYKDPKDYGRAKEDTTLTVPAATPSSLPGPAASPTPSVPSPSSEPGPLPESPVEQPPSSTSNELLGHFSFAGYFDVDSAVRIIHGSGSEGELDRGGFIDPIIKRFLSLIVRGEKKEKLDLITREEGAEKNSVIQIAHTDAGDELAALRHEESQSGTQTMDWILSSDSERECPKPFICVDRIVWRPEQGKLWTYCMRDLQSNEPLAVPYSPNPQFSSEAFTYALPDGFKVSRPFILTKHPGNVACKDSTIVTMTRDAVVWRVSLGNLSDARKPGFLRKATRQPLAIDSEIIVEYRPFNPKLGRSWQPHKPPFMDQMSRFSTKSRYFLSSKERVFVKIERTIQAPFSLSFAHAAYGYFNSSPSFANSMAMELADELRSTVESDNTTTGLQLTYNFEFCARRAVSDDLSNHCPDEPVH